MSLAKDVEVLRNIPLFAKVEPAKLKLLAFTSDRVTYGPGEILFHQGDIGDAAYVVLSGRADILVDSPSGQIKITDVQENSIVGEIAILCDVSRTATVKAATSLEALRISKEHFLKLLTEYPQVTIEIMRVLANRLSKTTMELTDELARTSKAE
jgi:CRP-like cAMP-binding protein